MDKEVTRRLKEDISKLEFAEKLIKEVLDNVKNMEGENIVIPIMLNSSAIKLRNVSNCLKIVIDPNAKVSISIPMFCSSESKFITGEWDEREIIFNSKMF